MKQLIIPFFFCSMLLALTGHAEEATKARLTGTWWGTMTGDASPPGKRWHWTVERKADGTYRFQGYWVDHQMKLYFPVPPEAGEWELKEGVLHYNSPVTGRAQPMAVRMEDGKVQWETKWPSKNETVKCSEEPAGKFASQIPADYRELKEHGLGPPGVGAEAEKVTEKEATNPDGKPEEQTAPPAGDSGKPGEPTPVPPKE